MKSALTYDYLTNRTDKVQALLNASVNILVYTGDKDFMGNWYGGQAWTTAQPWTGQAGFNAATY